MSCACREDLLTSMIPVYEKLLQADISMLVYSGDVDGIVPVIGTRRWIANLHLPIASPWRPWHSSTGTSLEALHHSMSMTSCPLPMHTSGQICQVHRSNNKASSKGIGLLLFVFLIGLSHRMHQAHNHSDHKCVIVGMDDSAHEYEGLQMKTADDQPSQGMWP